MPFRRWSSSAWAKNELAIFSISLVRQRSLTSRSSSLMRLASTVVLITQPSQRLEHPRRPCCHGNDSKHFRLQKAAISVIAAEARACPIGRTYLWAASPVLRHANLKKQMLVALCINAFSAFARLCVCCANPPQQGGAGQQPKFFMVQPLNAT